MTSKKNFSAIILNPSFWFFLNVKLWNIFNTPQLNNVDLFLCYFTPERKLFKIDFKALIIV